MSGRAPHTYHHHPWVHERKKQPPVRVADQLPEGNPVQRFNTRFALLTLGAVGSMWCAYLFAAYVLLALPEAIHSGVFGLVQWGASFFLQLVLLSIILVGQNVAARAADKQNLATYNDGEAALAEILSAQAHLLAQDELIKEAQRTILAAISASTPHEPEGST